MASHRFVAGLCFASLEDYYSKPLVSLEADPLAPLPSSKATPPSPPSPPPPSRLLNNGLAFVLLTSMAKNNHDLLTE